MVQFGRAMVTLPMWYVHIAVNNHRHIWHRLTAIYTMQVLTGDCEPPVWGRGGRRGWRWVLWVAFLQAPHCSHRPITVFAMLQLVTDRQTDRQADGIGLAKGGTMHQSASAAKMSEIYSTCLIPYCLTLTAPSGVTWRHRPCVHLIAHMPFPIGGPLEFGTESLNPAVFEILRSKHIGVTSLTFQGHVTSSVT